MSAFRPIVFSSLLLLAACTETGLEPTPPEDPIPSPEYAQLSVGVRHACALDVDGRAFCWGSNQSGELGDGTTSDRSAPVPVGGGHRFVEIEAGAGVSCGVTLDGELLCWGSVLGADRLLPVAVGSEGSTWHNVTSGGNYTICALDQFDRAFCSSWSSSGFDEVLDYRWRSLAAGDQHICGVTTAGAGFCWGFNPYGQLGVDQPFNSTLPMAAPGAETWAELVAGAEYTCGTTVEGRTLCWGYAERMALGTDTLTDDQQYDGVPEPIAVAGGALTISELTPGAGYASDRRVMCGRADIGRSSIVCWGDGQPLMNVGFGQFDWSTIEVGAAFACGLADGRIHCWTPTQSLEPIEGTYSEEFSRILYPDIEFTELPAPGREWRDA